MSKKTEALKLALERLEWFVESYPHDITTNKEEFLRPFKEALAHAPTVREQPAQDNTYNYAKSLAEAIFKQHFASDEHYASGRIVWGVNDTVIGILTQIDNMVADMVRRPAQQQEPVAIDPKDVKIEVVLKQMGGFAPVMTNGVRLTHIPTGIVVEETEERSAHRNRDVAWGRLTKLVTSPPAQQQEPQRWAAYSDGDERVTCHGSEDEACGDKEFDIDNEFEPGTEVEYLVAPMLSAKQMLCNRNAYWFGDRIVEEANNDLADDMGAEDSPLSMEKEDTEELGKLVIDFLCARGKTQWWTVDHKREEKRTYVAGSNDEAANGIKGEA